MIGYFCFQFLIFDFVIPANIEFGVAVFVCKTTFEDQSQSIFDVVSVPDKLFSCRSSFEACEQQRAIGSAVVAQLNLEYSVVSIEIEYVVVCQLSADQSRIVSEVCKGVETFSFLCFSVYRKLRDQSKFFVNFLIEIIG